MKINDFFMEVNNMDKMRRLVVTSYGDEQGETYRVALSPSNIVMVTTTEQLVTKQGMSLHRSVVKFIEDGETATLYLSGSDLSVLEDAAACFWLD